MAENALRTIVLAYRDIKDTDDIITKDRLGVFDIETKNLTLLAIFGIKDIVREEVPNAVLKCIVLIVHSENLKLYFLYIN